MKLLTKEIRFAALVLTVIVLLVGGYTVELPYMVNYLKSGRFWRISLLNGAVLGALLAFLALRLSHLTDDVQRLQLFFSIVLCLTLLSPLVISWSNRLGHSEAQQTVITIEEELARFGSRFGQTRGMRAQANTYILFFLLDNELFRITNDEPFFPTAQPGEQVELPLCEGRWSFRWVDK